MESSSEGGADVPSEESKGELDMLQEQVSAVLDEMVRADDTGMVLLKELVSQVKRKYALRSGADSEIESLIQTLAQQNKVSLLAI